MDLNNEPDLGELYKLMRDQVLDFKSYFAKHKGDEHLFEDGGPRPGALREVLDEKKQDDYEDLDF
jgi:hypothetical protein